MVGSRVQFSPIHSTLQKKKEGIIIDKLKTKQKNREAKKGGRNGT